MILKYVLLKYLKLGTSATTFGEKNISVAMLNELFNINPDTI